MDAPRGADRDGDGRVVKQREEPRRFVPHGSSGTDDRPRIGKQPNRERNASAHRGGGTQEPGLLLRLMELPHYISRKIF